MCAGIAISLLVREKRNDNLLQEGLGVVMFHFLTDFIDRDGIFANRKDIFIVNLYVLFLLRLMIFVLYGSAIVRCGIIYRR